MTATSGADHTSDTAHRNDEMCFDCGVRAATPGRPLVVEMYRALGRSHTRLTFKEVQVHVPICEICRAEENSVEMRRNRIVAACMFIPLVAGVALGISQGEILRASLFGLGVGFFLSLIARVTVGYKRRSREHPEIKSLLERGWSFDRPGT